VNTSRKMQRRQEAEVVGVYRRLVPCDAATTGRHLVQIGFDAKGNIRHLRSDCDVNTSDAVERLGGKGCGVVVAAIRAHMKAGFHYYHLDNDGQSPLEKTVEFADSAFAAGVGTAGNTAAGVRSERVGIAKEPGPLSWQGTDWRDTLLKRLVVGMLGPTFEGPYLQARFGQKALGSVGYSSDYSPGGRKESLVPILSRGSTGAWYVSEHNARGVAKHFGRKGPVCEVCHKTYPGIGNHLNGGIHADKVIACLKEAAHRLTQMAQVSYNLLAPAEPPPAYALGVQYIRGAA